MNEAQHSRATVGLFFVAILLTVWGRVAAGADGPSRSEPVRDAAARLPIRVEAFLGQQQVRISANAPRDVFPPDQTDILVAVTGPGGKVLEERGAGDPKSGDFLLRLDGKRLPPGRLTFQVAATNRKSGARRTASRELDRPLRPEWLGATTGISEAVPAPWTAVKIDGTAVHVWGREYRFGHSILPSEVLVQGEPLLAGPVMLRGRVDGKPIAWKHEPAACTAKKPAAVTLAGGSAAEGVVLGGTACVEYDGMLRVDLAIRPAAGKANIEQLLLEIPLRADRARYLYHFPGAWGSVANSGFLPAKGWAHAFKPFVWLGDEERGFCWFCESDENWRPADANRAITVDREDKIVVLRCRLIERPITIDRALSYTFGFQATPVKNPEKTVWDYRITHHGNYGLEREPETGSGARGSIVYAGAGHLRAESGTFECWYRPAFDSERELPFEKRKHPGNREILTVRWGADIGRGSNCGLYWNGLEQGPVAWSRKDGNVTVYLPAPLDWKAGVWHHLALTWSDKVRIYVDRKLLAEAPNRGFIPAPPERATIEIGSSQAKATIDEVRILGVARPPVETAAPFLPDAQTLLLDHFDDYGRKGAVTPGAADPAIRFAAAKFGQGPTWEPSLIPTRLEWLSSMGVRTICFHEHWSPYQSHPYVTEENRPRLRSLVEACHRQKINLLLYISRQLADNCPEWELYSKEALQEPNFGAYVRQPPQKAYIVCWKSPWKEFCLFHLDKLLAEFGHDGWYLDGPEWPMACANREHGCGYVGPDGAIRASYDIFATRDFMKRLYVLTRQRKPEGQLNIHNSTVMVIPTLGWGTSSWGGEQLDAIKPPVKTLDILPMDAFRTEFLGRQWGVPSEFLVYDGMPYYAKDLLAYTLLHGVLIRPSDNEQVLRISKLWKAYDAFPWKDAKMHPYWANAELLACSPAGVYATAYERPGDGLLIIVSNLGQQAVKGSLAIHPARLGWPGVGKAWDAISAAPVPCQSNRVAIALAPWEYRVLRVQGAVK